MKYVTIKTPKGPINLEVKEGEKPNDVVKRNLDVLSGMGGFENKGVAFESTSQRAERMKEGAKSISSAAKKGIPELLEDFKPKSAMNYITPASYLINTDLGRGIASGTTLGMSEKIRELLTPKEGSYAPSDYKKPDNWMYHAGDIAGSMAPWGAALKVARAVPMLGKLAQGRKVLGPVARIIDSAVRGGTVGTTLGQGRSLIEKGELTPEQIPVQAGLGAVGEVVGGSLQRGGGEIKSYAEKAKQPYQIRELTKQLEKYSGKYTHPQDAAEAVEEGLKATTSKLGKSIGAIKEPAIYAHAESVVSPQNYRNALVKVMKDYRLLDKKGNVDLTKFSRLEPETGKFFNRMAERINRIKTNPTLDEMEMMRKEVGGLLSKAKKTGDPESARIWGELYHGLRSDIDDAVVKLAGPEQGAELTKLNKMFSETLEPTKEAIKGAGRDNFRWLQKMRPEQVETLVTNATPETIDAMRGGLARDIFSAVDPTSGKISVKQLYNAIDKANPKTLKILYGNDADHFVKLKSLLETVGKDTRMISMDDPKFLKAISKLKLTEVEPLWNLGEVLVEKPSVNALMKTLGWMTQKIGQGVPYGPAVLLPEITKNQS